MERKLRLNLVSKFESGLRELLPDFSSEKIQSIYIWPGETVWRSDAENCSYFIVLSSQPKGYRDEINIELGWSRFKRFPELMQRPSIVASENIDDEAARQEGTVRLGSLCEPLFDWLPVCSENIQEVVDFLLLNLKEEGVPFLTRIT